MRRRTNKMMVYLSDKEKDLLEEVSLRKGTDASGVLRMGLLEMAERLGLPVPTRDTAAPEKKTR